MTGRMKAGWLCTLALLAGCGDDARSDALPVITSTLALSTAEDMPATLAIDAHDPDGLAVTIVVSTGPMHGAATISGTTLRYAPAADFHGPDEIRITVSDGARSTEALVTVSVTAVNDPPVAVADSFATLEDAVLSMPAGALLANDTDPDGDPLTVTAVSAASGGTVAFAGGMVMFTPTANSSGAAAFTYTVTDGTRSASASVTVAVGAVNDSPVAHDDVVTTAEEQPLVIAGADLVANDTDEDGQTLMVSAVANATGGEVALLAGSITFSPALDFNGDAGFDYTATDGAATSVAHVTVTVTDVEDAPVAVDDVATTPIGTPLVIAAGVLLANDTDPDPGATKQLTVVQNPQHGTVLLSGLTVTFTPAAGYVGPAGFEYIVSDGMLSDIGTVAVTVTPICGDGVVSLGEGCDDGGTASGNGCSTTCATEQGWTCTGAPSTCTPICNDGLVRGNEPCDDGDLDDTDGCTTSCVVGVPCNATAVPGADRFAVVPSTGSCYAAFDDEPTTFAAAETGCVALGGHLATITTPAEQAAVHLVHLATQTPYIGATDDANDTDAVFDWVTDEPWGMTSFAPAQPDDGPGGDGECLVVQGGASLWADASCTAAGAASGRICEIERASCGDGIVQPARGEQCDDGGFTPGDGCDPTCLVETLYISEYVEGTSNNKVVEIANPMLTAFDLGANACALKLFANGSATATNTLALTGSIAPGDVFVACNTSVSGAISAQCDTFNGGVMSFNGDDAVTLECNGLVLDAFGQVGFDPGTEWGTGLTSTADNTLRRTCGITHGDPLAMDVFDPAATFRGFATDTFDGIGLATCAP